MYEALRYMLMTQRKNQTRGFPSWGAQSLGKEAEKSTNKRANRVHLQLCVVADVVKERNQARGET